MPSKTEEYLALAQRTANGLTRYWESWTDYLTTASRLYKYPFADQLMIYAQRPDATACADYDVWNNRMNRYVRRGSKGIALLDESSGFPRLHYVFDVSDTGVRRNSRDPEMWQYNDDLKQPVSEMLSKTYGISGERVSQQLADVAGKLVADYWDNNGEDIRAIVDGSLLMDYDEAGVEMQFKSAAAMSVTYTLLERCGFEPAGWFDKDDFQAIYNFSTPDAVFALGAAVSDMSREVLRNIERTVKTTIRRRNNERSQHEYEQQSELHADRGLSSPEPDPASAEDPAGQVQQDAPELSEAAAPGTVQHDAPEREPVPAPDGGGADGREPDAADHDAASETEPGPGQGAESDGMGAAHEQPAGTGRGTGAERTDLQLSFFDAHIPTEAKQIESIDQAESKKSPSAFVLSQVEIENALRRGSNFEDSKLRIWQIYQMQPDRKLRAKALAKEYAPYGPGGSSHTYLDGSSGWLDHDSKGLTFEHYPDHQKVLLRWDRVEKYIDLMIQSDRYLSDKERRSIDFPLELNAASAAEYTALKAQHPDTLVGFEAGGNFMFYGEDAAKVAKVLNSALFTRETALGEVQVTGFPPSLWARKSKELWSAGNDVYLAGLNEDGTHPDNDPRGEWMTASYVNPATKEARPNLSYEIHAIHLRRENMVKLPVFVMNRNNQLDVLNNAVQMQSILEAQAMAEYRNGGCYIRPIVLFQAQPKGKEDAATFEKIRTILVKNGIPAEQIAIKTADINELKNADLLSPNCPIRFIITVNALKEGWDCPFAYILASLANRTSQVDVEQIVGRILRLPYTRKHPVPALNMSYVLTSSADFKHTLDGIVKGLNNAGFTDQDYRAQEETPVPAPLPAAQQTTFIVTPPVPAEEPQDIFDDPDTVRLDPVCVNSTTEPQKIAPAVQNILAQAGKEIVAFETALQQHKDDPASDLPQEAQKMVGQTKVKAEFSDEIEQLILPKFCLKIPQSILMPSDTQELTKENLLSNFTLKGKPSNIDFDHLDNNLAQVDLDGDGTPRASKMESQYQQFIGQQFPLMPGENRLKLCRNIIHTTLSRQKKLNAVDDTELQRYVDYIIDGMNQDQLDALEQMPVNFANKICDYIIKLQEETARENFYNWLEVGKIVTEPRFKLTSHITLSGKASSLTKSLYKQECELDDNFEYDMAMALTGIDSVRWWHRNPTSGRNAFCLNAFRNHYPDFIVMTNSGKVLLVETKGDQLENAESREKIKLGRAWQNAAGSQYRYYMVFQNKDLHLEGAYRFDEFLKILGEL